MPQYLTHRLDISHGVGEVEVVVVVESGREDITNVLSMYVCVSLHISSLLAFLDNIY